jgi:triacylglycerol lipase
MMRSKSPPVSKDTECVILLHGLVRTRRSMSPIEKGLSNHGYHIINVDYPSTKHPIEYLADHILDDVIKSTNKTPRAKIHFVTHSLGGIVVRYYLRHHQLLNLGRVVMLSPPNQGSELVDWLKDTFLFKKWHGPAGQQLSASANSFLQSLGPVHFELGIITGDKTFDPLASFLIPGPHDGRVSVERAKVQGMKDFLVLPRSHTFIMRNKGVIVQVIHFLRHGAFKHASATAGSHHESP